LAGGLRKIEVGFYGAAVIALRVSDEELEKLRSKLGDDGWHRIATDDGEMDFDLAKLAFLRVADDSQKVGF
jgi:hypothetical protein